MQVTSTQFQQNVGRYLSLADQGEEIEIKRLKPAGSTYKLKLHKKEIAIPIKKRVKGEWTKSEFLELAKKYQITGKPRESALEFQHRVRS